MENPVYFTKNKADGGNMGKIIISFIIFITLINNVHAAGLELSDVIKQARETSKTEIYKNNQNNALKPVKNNEKINNESEKNACEKINPAEILNNSDLSK